MSQRTVLLVVLLTMGVGMAALANAQTVAVAATAAPRHPKCGPTQEEVRVLRLTTVGEDGVRVDYEFLRPGPRTWTNMNRALLKQFGVRAGGTFCLPRDALVAEVAGAP